MNDDGEGHANVITVGGTTYLYTLPRAAGDMQGVGLDVHKFSPSETNPLTGLPRTEKTGVDPDAFVPSGSAGVTVTHTTGRVVPLTTTGTANSPEQLVTGGFVDATVDPHPTITDVFTCTVTLGSNVLTGCMTVKTGTTVAVAAGNEIEQVMGYSATKKVIPAGATQKTIGTGGLTKFQVIKKPTGKKATRGFTNRLTGTTLNTDAPNRLYVDGHTVYCTNSTTNPTAKITGCTTGAGNPAFTAPANSPITGDPIVPPTTYQAATGDGMSSGLVAPDGIVGVLPRYPGAPSGSTIVMYTEKELGYYVAGRTPKTTVATTTESTFGSTIKFTPGPYFSQDMPATVSPASPVTVTMGDLTTKSIASITCTGLTTVAGATITDTTTVTFKELTRCAIPAADAGHKYTSSSWIGAPGATTVPLSTLALTGEGKTTPKKLDKNNEDRTLLRVAYTTTGVHFSDANLANTGIVSGNGTENGASYNDINNPSATANPKSATGAIDLNEYAKAGTADATEMRWVGSAGSIITNGGTLEMFLSGAWAADGDSDAFNQIFYSQSTTGAVWSVPRTVLSTDYTFSASMKQDAALANGQDTALTISAYYEGRAYGPSVVQRATGTLTMVFAGYRLPKTIADDTTTIGTGYTGAPAWKITKTDPALYRNILAVNLSPSVATQTTVSATPPDPVVGQPVTLTATVSVPGATAPTSPTGSVVFSGQAGTLCTATLSTTTPGKASCTYAYAAVGGDAVSAAYQGDATHVMSQSATPTPVTIGPDATTTGLAVTPPNPAVAQQVTLTASVSPTAPGTSSPTGVVTFSDSTGVLCQGPLSGGPVATAQCDATFAGAGTYGVTASYRGSVNDTASTSPATALAVGKDATTATVSETQPTATYPTEHAAVFGAAVVSHNGEAVPDGETATVHVGSATCTVVLKGGSGACSIPAGSLTVGGPYQVSATYGGDGNLIGSTSTNVVDFSVSAVPVTATVSGTTVFGSAAPSFTYSATPAVPLSGTVFCGSVGSGTAIVATPPLEAGTYTVTGASCTGLSATGYAVSYVGAPLGFAVLQDPTTTTVGEAHGTALYPNQQTALFTVTVSAGNAQTVPDGETAVIHVGSATCTATLTAGTGSCKLAAGALPVGGPYPVSATYGGDANLTPSSSANAVTFSVNSAPVTVTVAGSRTYGSSASASTFTFTDSPAVALTGTLSCSAVATGTAIAPTLAAGTYAVTGASCSGLSATGYTVSYLGAPKGFVVAKDATATKVSAPASSSYANEATASFGVTVTPHNGEAGPTGEHVTIHVGSASCTAVLSAGSGSCKIAATLAVGGPYAVSATYAGDANLLGSSSAPKVTFSVVTVSTPSCSRFRGANLRGDNLAGANLAGCNLSGANLQTANLAGANLDGANVAGANLAGANLQGAALTGAVLTGANLANAHLLHADLQSANLTGANLQLANLTGADLQSANLTGANLQSANLTDADLHNANLTGANLRLANLSGANLTGAKLTGANLAGAIR